MQAMIVCLLLLNSVRLLDDAITQNAHRVAREYAATLNLSLEPYAEDGRLAQLRPFLAEMIASPHDSYLRYLLIIDSQQKTVLSIGKIPPVLPPRPVSAGGSGLQTRAEGQILHASAPFLLRGSEVGSLHFGVATEELGNTRASVLRQGGLIAIAGLAMGMGLLYWFTRGLGQRLSNLAQHSNRLAQGDYGAQLLTQGHDEIEVFAGVLNRMSSTLVERIKQLEISQRMLAESEARFKTLFELAPVPLTVTDAQGHVLGANLAMSRVFGYQLEDVLGKTSVDFQFWESFDERQRIWQSLRENGTVEGVIANARSVDGRVVELAVWSSSVRDDDSGTIIWALLDLTAELQAKRALHELNASLEERVKERASALEKANAELFATLETLRRTQNDLVTAEKMASLGSLVAGVAHELNTPIGNSLLMASALNDRVDEFEKSLYQHGLRRSEMTAYLQDTHHACQLMITGLQKAAHLIASFKQVAVDQTHDRRREFDLKTVLQDSLTTFAPRLQRHHCHAQLEVEAGLILDSFPGSLCQIIDNLINNALLHAFEGKEEGNIHIQAKALEGNLIELIFSDNGAGMSADVLHHVFDPFFTTKMGQGGTGLGMHIVYNIVTGILGGHIEIHSRCGEGSQVIMRLPRKAPQHELHKSNQVLE